MAHDKKLHMGAGFLITLVIGLLNLVSDVTLGVQNLYIGFMVGIIAGIAKEIYDYCDYGLFDIKDMFATWAGSLVGLGVAYILAFGV